MMVAMMWLSFEKTLRSFADTIVETKQQFPEAAARHGPEVAMFLISVHRKMPDYLRPPFWGLVLLFDAWSLPMTGPFHRLEHADRAAQIEAWRQSSLEFQRRFIEFYGSLAVFGLYSDLYHQDYL